MAKRTLQDLSDSDEESRKDLRTKSKKPKTVRPESKFKHDIFDSDDEINPSTSIEESSQHESFTSFLKCISFNSESEDEGDRLLKSKQVKSKRKSLKKESTKVSMISASTSATMHETITDSDKDAFIDGKGVSINSFAAKHCEVLCLAPHSSLTLHGYIKVHSRIGSVSIFGKILKEGESVNVLSTEMVGLKIVQYFKSSLKFSASKAHKKLSDVFEDHENLEIKKFIEGIEYRNVVITVEKLFLPSPLQFIQLYYPSAVQTKLIEIVEEKYEKNFCLSSKLPMCSNEKNCTLEVTKDFKFIAKEVIAAVNSSNSSNSGLRLLVHGDVTSGKSTLLRYLINRVLNERSVVYYLDVDPGQTEFTPPGVVSLIKVTQPLLEPPYFHQKKPVKMIFIGSVTVASPPMYYKSVQSLLKLFNTKFPQEALFVNTMGWIKGIGAVINESVRNFVQPNFIIELKESSLKKSVENKNVLIKAQAYDLVKARNQQKSRKNFRAFTILAYIGKCLKYYMPPAYINALRPVSVCWDDIAISIMGKSVPPNRLIEAIHCSFVALCYVHESFMLESSEPDFPRTLCEEPINECLGFGIVRAADETNRLLYIVTPMSLDELKKVNAIIKGDIALPEKLLIKQPIQDVELPYTDEAFSASLENIHKKFKIKKKRSHNK